MTLPKGVQSAIGYAQDFVRPYNNARVNRSLATLSAHLLSQDAENWRLREDRDSQQRAAMDAMSRLAAADALLREASVFVFGDLSTRIAAHLSENTHVQP